MTKFSSRFLVGLSMSVGLLLSGCANSSSAQIATGNKIYDQNCASCHGPQGQGQYPEAPLKPDKEGLFGAPPHNATGHTWHHADGLILDIIRNGRVDSGFHPMPAFKDKLTEEEIQAVLVYIKIWWKPDQLEFQATVSAKYTPSAP